MNKRRLLALAKKLDTIPRKRFEIAYWVGSTWKGRADLSCGTVACAMGWATTMPSFRRLGLHMDKYADVTEDHCGNGGNVVFDGFYGFSAAMRLFDIKDTDAMWLFSGSSYPMKHGEYRATPKQVAKRIRKFVENGAVL